MAENAHQYRLLQVSEFVRPVAEEEFTEWLSEWRGVLTPSVLALVEDLLEALAVPVLPEDQTGRMAKK